MSGLKRLRECKCNPKSLCTKECRENTAIDPVPVEGMVLPTKPCNCGGDPCIQAKRLMPGFHCVNVHEVEFRLADAIAQRDAARELAVTHKATYDVNMETLKRNHEIERRDWQQDMCDCKAKAEATLATEREVSSDLRENLSASIADAKLWRDNVATERARNQSVDYDTTVAERSIDL